MAKAGTPGVRASCPTSRADEPGQGRQAMQHTKRTAHLVNLCQFLSRSLPHPSRLPDLLYTTVIQQKRGERMMNLRSVVTLSSLILGLTSPALAQQSASHLYMIQVK